MRLDKFLCDSLGVTRKEATQILKSKTVTVNDVMQKAVPLRLPKSALLNGKAMNCVFKAHVTSWFTSLKVLFARMKTALIARFLTCLMRSRWTSFTLLVV